MYIPHNEPFEIKWHTHNRNPCCLWFSHRQVSLTYWRRRKVAVGAISVGTAWWPCASRLPWVAPSWVGRTAVQHFHWTMLLTSTSSTSIVLPTSNNKGNNLIGSQLNYWLWPAVNILSLWKEMTGGGCIDFHCNYFDWVITWPEPMSMPFEPWISFLNKGLVIILYSNWSWNNMKWFATNLNQFVLILLCFLKYFIISRNRCQLRKWYCCKTLFTVKVLCFF